MLGRGAAFWILCVSCGMLATAGAADARQQPSLAMVLARAAAYVGGFSQQLSGIVAEETYSQQVHQSRPSIITRRRLRSDLLLVRPEGVPRYVEFRDVFEVDGAPVRDREDRLSRLFVNPDANADTLKAIIEESARYNLGALPRNVNTPMLPLLFLQPAEQRRFRFTRAGADGPALTGHATPEGAGATFHTSTEMWSIAFKETEKRTLIRTYDGHDFPASGRFWIDPATGAVLMTELVMNSLDVRAVINVSYQSEPLLGFLVPVEMRERYVTSNQRIDGVAAYGRFRQFRVRTDQEIAPPSKPPAKPPGKPPGSME